MPGNVFAQIESIGGTKKQSKILWIIMGVIILLLVIGVLLWKKKDDKKTSSPTTNQPQLTTYTKPQAIPRRIPDRSAFLQQREIPPSSQYDASKSHPASLAQPFVPEPYNKSQGYTNYSQSQSHLESAAYENKTSQSQSNTSLFTNANQLRDKLENARSPLVVAFLSKNCGHCHKLKPILEKACTSHPVIPIVAIDISEPINQPILRRYPIEAIPTILKFKNGSVVDEYRGDRSLQSLLQFASV